MWCRGESPPFVFELETALCCRGLCLLPRTAGGSPQHGSCRCSAGWHLPSAREGPADFTGLGGPRHLCHLFHSSLYWCAVPLPVHSGSLRSETGCLTAPEGLRPRSCSVSSTPSHGGPPSPCIGGFLLGHFCPFEGALVPDYVPFGQVRGLWWLVPGGRLGEPTGPGISLKTGRGWDGPVSARLSGHPCTVPCLVSQMGWARRQRRRLQVHSADGFAAGAGPRACASSRVALWGGQAWTGTPPAVRVQGVGGMVSGRVGCSGILTAWLWSPFERGCF